MLRKQQKRMIWQQTWSPGGESFVNRISFFLFFLNPYCPFWQKLSDGINKVFCHVRFKGWKSLP